MAASQGGVALPPQLTTEKIQSKFDLSIALALSTWPALTLAIQNSWGGPESVEKRDWFAGAISDLIAGAPDADVEYLEEFLLQVMNDEFDVNVEDGSAEEIAAKIIGLRKLTNQGDFAMVDEMYQQWQERQSRVGSSRINFQLVDRKDDEDDTDWDSDDIQEEDDMMDIDGMPQANKSQKERIQPKIDDDGFTEVISKKRR
ncbi:rRNA accumulation-related protein [Lecanora helva]